MIQRDSGTSVSSGEVRQHRGSVTMTREEAVKRIITARWGEAAFEDTKCQADAYAAVDEYCRLGMLELEHPKSARQKFRDELVSRGYGEKSREFADVLIAYDLTNTESAPHTRR